MPYRAKTLGQIKKASGQQPQGQTKARSIRDSVRWQRFRSWFKKRHPVCIDPLGIHPEEIRPVAQVHHIESLNKRPDLAYTESNCASVCTECHGLIEAMERQGKSTGHLFKDAANE